MPTAATLRLEIERSLQHRFPSALTPEQRTVCEVAPTGIEEVDALLDGGLPVGAISEITGAQSSGRTSLALAFVAQRTRDEQVCAWVDVSDALDPESAAASGVALPKLLWIRCRDAGTQAKGKGSNGKPWSRLDQAVRATDLLLQAGGFAAIVLDLGDTAPEHASRIPLATWFRFRQAAHRARTCLVVLGQDAYAQSSAAAVLECTQRHEAIAGETVLDGLRFEVVRQRQRSLQMTTGKKPPASVWPARGAWNAVRRA
ncbi:MAG: ATPase domain-containing protein [Terracidiphilus sp.]|jgi:hypothetical protein